MECASFYWILMVLFCLESVANANCKAHVLRRYFITISIFRFTRSNESMLSSEVYEVMFAKFNTYSPLES